MAIIIVRKAMVAAVEAIEAVITVAKMGTWVVTAISPRKRGVADTEVRESVTTVTSRDTSAVTALNPRKRDRAIIRAVIALIVDRIRIWVATVRNPKKRGRRLASIVTKADISVVIVLKRDVTVADRIREEENEINNLFIDKHFVWLV
jgi:hypothetical protein